jgi:hypothetical protein
MMASSSTLGHPSRSQSPPLRARKACAFDIEIGRGSGSYPCIPEKISTLFHEFQIFLLKRSPNCDSMLINARIYSAIFVRVSRSSGTDQTEGAELYSYSSFLVMVPASDLTPQPPSRCGKGEPDLLFCWPTPLPVSGRGRGLGLPTGREWGFESPRTVKQV